MKVCIFLTRGYSLFSWKKSGTLNRELSYYSELKKKGIEIYFLSYGSKTNEIDLIKRNKFSLLLRPKYIPKLLYSFLIPIIHYKILKKIDVIKTNQIQGTLEAFLSSLILAKPLYSRSGYIPSTKSLSNYNSGIAKILIYIEEFIAVKFSKRISVSSKVGIEHLKQKFNLNLKKTELLYNFVNDSFFVNYQKNKKVNLHKKKIYFIGRLVETKQPYLLFEILRDFHDIELNILGNGVLIDKIKKLSSVSKFKTNIFSNLDNNQVVTFLKKNDILILPTLWEGNSKVILEAMASGKIIITNDIESNREIIQNGKNGFLIKNNSIAGYRKCLNKIFKDEFIYSNIVDNAVKFANLNFRKDKFLDIELSQLKKCIVK